MTEKELMEWYEKWWKNNNPDWTKCKLEFCKTKNFPNGVWCLKVDKKSWKEPNVRYPKDAKYQWEKLNDPNMTKKQTLNLQVELPFNASKRGNKKYKSISCCVERSFYEKIKMLCDKHNMTMNELIKKLLIQVIVAEERR